MLIITFHNDGTGTGAIGNYEVEVLVTVTATQLRTLYNGRIEGHVRDRGWLALVCTWCRKSLEIDEGRDVYPMSTTITEFFGEVVLVKESPLSSNHLTVYIDVKGPLGERTTSTITVRKDVARKIHVGDHVGLLLTSDSPASS